MGVLIIFLIFAAAVGAVIGLIFLINRLPWVVMRELKVRAYNSGFEYGYNLATGSYLPADLKHYYKNSYTDPKKRAAYDAEFTAGTEKGTAKRNRINANRDSYANA
jgi:hypothetical protein